MSKKTSWPFRKGIFRPNFPTDVEHQRSPSPIVEMPLSPEAKDTTELPQGNTSPLKLNTNGNLEFRGPFSPTIREIPIEVQQEVRY